MSFPPRYRTMRAKSRGEISGEASRAKAIQVAMELFATSGYRSTSIAKVAEQTGLSQSGLLHHFPSKAALLTAVLEERDTEDGTFMNNEGEEPPLGWAAFDALTALVARNSTRPQVVGLFVRVSAEAIDPAHPGHDWIRDHYAGLEAWLTDALQTGKERGEISQEAPINHLVHTTIAVLDGLQQQWLLFPEQISMVKEFTTHINTMRAQWAAS